MPWAFHLERSGSGKAAEKIGAFGDVIITVIETDPAFASQIHEQLAKCARVAIGDIRFAPFEMEQRKDMAIEFFGRIIIGERETVGAGVRAARHTAHFGHTSMHGGMGRH